MNATLVETLLGCVTGNWACEAFLEYVVGEIANIVSPGAVAGTACVPHPRGCDARSLDCVSCQYHLSCLGRYTEP